MTPQSQFMLVAQVTPGRERGLQCARVARRTPFLDRVDMLEFDSRIDRDDPSVLRDLREWRRFGLGGEQDAEHAADGSGCHQDRRCPHR